METKLIQKNIIITVHFIYLWMVVLSYFIYLRMAVLSSFLATPFPLTWIKQKIEIMFKYQINYLYLNTIYNL